MRCVAAALRRCVHVAVFTPPASSALLCPSFCRGALLARPIAASHPEPAVAGGICFCVSFFNVPTFKLANVLTIPPLATSCLSPDVPTLRRANVPTIFALATALHRRCSAMWPKACHPPPARIDWYHGALWLPLIPSSLKSSGLHSTLSL